MKVFSLILAAGKGTRMNSKHHKGIHKICGKEMINIIIDKLKFIGVEEINVIVGQDRESVINATSSRNVSYSFQEEQLGTGHAVMCSKDFLKDKDGYVLIFACDTPLLKKENIEKLINSHRETSSSVTLVTSFVENGASYGRIIRQDNEIIDIREAKDCSDKELLINEINTSIYCFNISELLDSLKELKNDNCQGEYYLTDVISLIRKNGGKINSINVLNNEVIGIDTRSQLIYANKILREEINNYHIQNGVTILDINSTYIDIDVRIGIDTLIHPNVHISGNTSIGSSCQILPNTRIENSYILDNCVIEASVICESKVGENSLIGPFAYLRPNSLIGNRVKIGDFVEVKNSSVGDDTKISHLSYVGDSDIGKKCNLGCGIVTVNYDGKNKHKTVVEDDCFIGCNVNLIAPVLVENNSYVAAGTTVTEIVKSKSLAIGRVRQTNIENWVVRKNK